jgi:glyoxylase-like metal-dependent hydrolase (beta-lactamase superfamily II)
MSEEANETFHSYHVGDIEVSVVSDGFIILPLAEGLVPNAPIGDVRNALSESGLATDTLRTTFAPLILRIRSQKVLVDTGLGPDLGDEPGSTKGLLIRNMRENDFDPGDVDVVVVSHFHADHVNGLVARDGPVFPNAKIAVPEREWSFWMDDGEMSRAAEGRMSQLFENNRRVFDQVRDRISMYRWGEEVVPGLEAVAAPGHSIGHTAFWLRSGDERLFIQSDLTNQAALFVSHPEWYTVLDQFPAETVRVRRKIYDMLAADRVAVQAFHHPFPGRCYIEKDGLGYRRVAIA